MAEEETQQQPTGNRETLRYAVSAPVLKAAIDLIDEEINGKKGRPIVNMLEQSPLLLPEAMAAQNAAVAKKQKQQGKR